MSSNSKDNPSISAETTLVTAEGKSYALQSPCEIGRSGNCYITLDDDQASRTHCLIQRDSGGYWWITDLDSTNGTYVNKRKITQTTMLADGDLVAIGSTKLDFKDTSQKQNKPDRDGPESPTGTHILFSQTTCWLLIANIINPSTPGKEQTSQARSNRISEWGKTAEIIINRHNGEVNRFLGDGFLAYWNCGTVDAEQIVQAITELTTLHSGQSLDFRLILHLGQVQLGGLLNKGEGNLSGTAVNFIFKAEKLADSIDQRTFISAVAAKEMPGAPLKTLGTFKVPGFPGETEFHALETERA